MGDVTAFKAMTDTFGGPNTQRLAVIFIKFVSSNYLSKLVI